GHEPLRDSGRGAGREHRADLPWRAALPGRGLPAPAAADPVPRARARPAGVAGMTPTAATRLAAILADPLASARASGNALAYVGTGVPPDRGLAAARPFCHLPWRSGRATPWADQWLEAAFPDWARSLREDWAAGAFDCFEAVIFSRGDDAAQRLYYYVCELQRRGRLAGPRALILDLALVPRESSVRHCRLALARL